MGTVLGSQVPSVLKRFFKPELTHRFLKENAMGNLVSDF